HLDKGFALIFRAVNPALSKMLDQNIDEIGIPAIDIDGAAANVAVSGQAARQPGPVRAAIERSVYAALGTSAVISEDGAAALVGGRVKNVGTFRVDRDVGHAGVIVDKKHFVPSGAAIGALEDAAVGIRSPEIAECRNVDHIGIRRMHDDPADVVGVLEPD